jgi:hypothetical protein
LSLFVLSLAWAALVPLAWLRLAWPATRCSSPFVLRASLAAGLGLGMSSCSFLLLVLLGIRSRSGLIAAEALLFVIPGLLLARSAWRRLPQTGASRIRPDAAGWVRTVLLTVFSASLASGLCAFALLFLRAPHGDVDSWAIWNLGARLLFRGGENWPEALSALRVGHPDYPLLVAGAVARGWRFAGAESTSVPAGIALIFAGATVGLLASSLSWLRGSCQGWLAGTLLLGTPLFLSRAATGQADVPLGFFILGVTVLGCLGARTTSAGRSLAPLAGLLAALAAWTKNEGLLFLFAALAWQVGRCLASRERAAARVWLRGFLTGTAPVLVVVLLFKVALAPRNDLLSGEALGLALPRLLVPERYGQVAHAFERGMVFFGDWKWSVPALLGVYVWSVGSEFEAGDEAAIVGAAVPLLVTLAGYFVVYILTPYDLAWHLATSLKRLLLQLWPSALFVLFLVARPPESWSGTNSRLGEPGPRSPGP